MCNTLQLIVLTFLFLIPRCPCIRVRIPVGVIVEPGEEVQASVLRHGLWLQDQKRDWPRQFVLELKSETASLDDPTQLDRAVSRLLKEGIHALVAPTTPLAYQVLSAYADEYRFPFISPLLPEVPRFLESRWSFSIQPNTTWPLLDLLRYKQYKDIVYLYDDRHGSERLQKIFGLGYSALNIKLLGLLEVKSAQQVNQFLRKLEVATNSHSFNVILDVDVLLAMDIISWHIHDTRVGKNNYHFIIAEPVPENFWTSKNHSFGAVNVTSFLSLSAKVEKDFQKMWDVLSPDTWKGAGKENLNIRSYFYHEAGVVLGRSMRKYLQNIRYRYSGDDLEEAKKWFRDVLVTPSQKLPDNSIAGFIKEAIINEGQSGRFELQKEKIRFVMPIVEIRKSGPQLFGTWSDREGLHVDNSERILSTALPMKDEKLFYKIISILNPPFLAISNEDNVTGNGRFIGYNKDLMDLLARELRFEYTIHFSDDGEYGRYNKTEGQWTGMIGQLIRGEGDMVIADLHISADRHRVVDFVDAHLTASLSLLMKHPEHLSPDSTPFFFLNIFSKEIWICLVASAIGVMAIFHGLFIFIAAPDNIEAASGIWGKKLTFSATVWFTLGSGLFQPTAVYPRCISSRILGATWWCFNLALVALYIASTTTQLSANGPSMEKNPKTALLSSLSLESIIKESIYNDWPSIAVLKNSKMHRHIKQSNLPFLKEYVSHLMDHPENAVKSMSKAVQKVRQSKGDFAVIMESLYGHYYSKQIPCDTMAAHDVIESFFYGIAVPYGSDLRIQLNEALETLSVGGELSHLREKWFFNRSVCETKTFSKHTNTYETLYTQSGLFYVLTFGLALVALVAVLQHFWRVRRKDERRQKLSFEEVAMGVHTLPLPPPELLRDSSEEEENGAIDGWADRKLVPTSFGLSSRHNNDGEDALLH